MSVRVVSVRFNETTFEQIKAAATETQLPICSYLKEVVEADLASRRMASPPVESASTRTPRNSTPQKTE